MDKNGKISSVLLGNDGTGDTSNKIGYMLEMGEISNEELGRVVAGMLEEADPGWELLGTDMIGCVDRAEKIRKELGMEKPAWESAGVSSFEMIQTLHSVRREFCPELRSIPEIANDALGKFVEGRSGRAAIEELRKRNMAPLERELKILRAGGINTRDWGVGIVATILQDYFLGLCTPGLELISSHVCDTPGGEVDGAYATNRDIQDVRGSRVNQRIPIATLMAETDPSRAVQFFTELIHETSLDKEQDTQKHPGESKSSGEGERIKREEKRATEVFNAAIDALLAVGGPSIATRAAGAIDKIFENEKRSVDGIRGKPFELLGASLARGVWEKWLGLDNAEGICGDALSLAIERHNKMTQREREAGDEHYNMDFTFSKVAGIGAPVSVRLCSCVREFLDGEELDKYETRTLLSLMHGVRNNSYSLSEWEKSKRELMAAIEAIAETSLAVLGATDNKLIASEANDALAMLGQRHMRQLVGVLNKSPKLKAAYDAWREEGVVDLSRYTSFVAKKRPTSPNNRLRRQKRMLPGGTA